MVGKQLVLNLHKNSYPLNSMDFQSYCHKGIKESMYVEPADKSKLLRLVESLSKSKSPGPA
jgi:hypothetical protein